MSTKKCSKCGVVRNIESFSKCKRDGTQSRCRPCINEYNRTNRRQISDRQKKYYQANWSRIHGVQRKYRKVNVDKIRESNSAYVKNRIRTDPIFKLRAVLRQCTRRVKVKFGVKSRTAQLLGCTWVEAHAYLIQTAITNYGFYDEGQFYHIDHVVPLSSATTEGEAAALCRIHNLQYLTPSDNLAKSDQLDWDSRELRSGRLELV